MDYLLISVIVPVYNVEKYLNICMETICNQTYKNLEIILIDDGSKDSSGLICEKWKYKDSRVRVIHKQNGGLSSARNVGIKESKGEYICFVDSDDVLDYDSIEYLFNLIREYGADISICDPVHCYPNIKHNFVQENKRIVYSNPQNAIVEMFYQKSFLVSAWGKLYKKECFNEIYFPEGMLFEDSAIMYKVFENAKKIAYGNARKYGYMHREGSITTKKFSNRDLDILKISNEILDYAMNRPELIPAARAYYVTANLRVYLNAIKEENYKKIIDNCRKNIKDQYWKVFLDKNIRQKLRISLILFWLGHKPMQIIHKHKNRWE